MLSIAIYGTCMSLLLLKVTIFINYHKLRDLFLSLSLSKYPFDFPLDIDKSLKEIVIIANDNDLNFILINIYESRIFNLIYVREPYGIHS